MLDLAYKHKEQLQQKYQEILFNDKYKYYFSSRYRNYDFKINNVSWDGIQMVSINRKHEILGIFEAFIYREGNLISSLSIINFSDKCNIIFSKDLYQFILDLFYKFSFNKIEFLVVCGNSIETMYDKYINKYGGRIIGKRKRTVVLQDGKFYDMKYYEIFQNDFKYYFERTNFRHKYLKGTNKND